MTTKITEQNISQLANAGVDWQAVFTGDGSTGLTAVAGRGYFIDTTSGTVTVTLPASPSAGDVVVLKDYARTWNTNNVTIASALTDGAASENTFSTNGQTVTLVYMDGTKGWSLINEDTSSELNIPPTFIAATGGTVTESGDYKIHTFTGDGCFVVSSVGNAPVVPTGGPTTVSYLVVAGGAGGGAGFTNSGNAGGGGGAGGFREGKCTSDPYSASPLVAPDGLTVSATTYPITVGAGGPSQPSTATGSSSPSNGSPSIFSTITSAGGGAGGNRGDPNNAAQDGGSGGGATGPTAPPSSTEGIGGSGNTPPVSPPQGSSGSPNTSPVNAAGGGGGATENGAGAVASGQPGGNGGAGATTSISGSSTAYAGGGGGGGSTNGGNVPSTAGGGNGGTGGGGTGSHDDGSPYGASAGTANTGGGGGGGGGSDPGTPSAAGGKGIVIIRYKFQ